MAWADAELAWAVSEGLTPSSLPPTHLLASKHYGRTPRCGRRARPRPASRGEVDHDGHVHGYERFVVDGVHYMTDGGGGALTYDLEEGREEVEAARPGESELRVVAEGRMGVLVIDAGTVSVADSTWTAIPRTTSLSPRLEHDSACGEARRLEVSWW